MGRRRSRRTQLRLDLLDRGRERLARRRFERYAAKGHVRRELTPHERAVLVRMLAADEPGVEQFRGQVDWITVVYECPCGECGSISFEVDETRAEQATEAKWIDYEVVSEASGHSWLMLHQRDGWLTELEQVAGYGEPLGQVDPDLIELDSEI